MDAAMLSEILPANTLEIMPDSTAGRIVNATEFRELLVSHRRMVRFDRREERVRGLRDLDTGEVFLIDERRLFDARR